MLKTDLTLTQINVSYKSDAANADRMCAIPYYSEVVSHITHSN